MLTPLPAEWTSLGARTVRVSSNTATVNCLKNSVSHVLYSLRQIQNHFGKRYESFGRSYTEEIVACRKFHADSFLLISTHEKLSLNHAIARGECFVLLVVVTSTKKEDYTSRQRSEFTPLIVAKELNVDEEKFRSFYRMSHSSLRTLVRLVEPKLMKKDTNWRMSITAEERLLNTVGKIFVQTLMIA
jgi:hypothetical protein